MALSKDNKGVGHKKNPDPDDLLTKTCTTKTIIFIRHGESDWNHVFNKDSPLNLEGIDQAVELRKFLEDSTSLKGASDEVVNHIRTLRGEGRSSIVVSSTLRRAVATTTVALWPRVERRHEKIHILSSLQEISRNVDTYSLSAAEKLADLPFNRITPHCGGTENFRPDQQTFDTEDGLPRYRIVPESVTVVYGGFTTK
eukprot:scaffold2913_cov181-Ochromonas_danica.AAC.3